MGGDAAAHHFSRAVLFSARPRQIARARAFVVASDRTRNHVFKRVSETIRGMVFWHPRGGDGGAMFSLLGLPAPALWGAVMAVLSTVPVLGTFVIWLPAAGFLALGGDWGKALILAIWGPHRPGNQRSAGPPTHTAAPP